jgi:2'-5' RNA ligase
MTDASQPSMRLFVAIELPAEWLRVLEGTQAELRPEIEKRGGPALRWVQPEGSHLTLKFLGETGESRLEAIEDGLRSATTVAPDFSLSMGRVSCFGDRRGPRVVWVGLDGETVPDRKKLYDLAERIETWMAAAGFPREGRFAPHLTLARLPETLSREQRAVVAEAVVAMPPRQAPPMRVGAVRLIRSHLGRGGARYEPLAAFPR